METVRIRDGKKSDPGSGINIPDPPHCTAGMYAPVLRIQILMFSVLSDPDGMDPDPDPSLFS
jgi:hypothetical protein